MTNNEKKISDYLHLYLGCECVTNDGYDTNKTTVDGILIDCGEQWNSIKLILRPLNTITDAEQHELSKMVALAGTDNGANYWWGTQVAAHRTKYLLEKGFDLFGLIEAGLAIDAATQKEKQKSQ